MRNAKRWLDTYVSTDTPALLLSKFERAFGEDPFLFGISVDNVKQLTEVFAEAEYRNEAVIKSSFINHVMNVDTRVVGFEFPVGNNRVDLCAIDNRSSAFEIKTAYDTLARLDRQLSAYLRVFEYVYVICEESKLDEVLLVTPPCVGIYSYSDTSRKIKFVVRRPAKRSDRIDETVQRSVFPSTLKAADDVNNAFKTSIRKKYKKHWDYLKANMDHISALDYQASFQMCRCF